MRKTYTLFIIAFLFIALHSSATNFIVTNTNDNGTGSLRQAINNANMSAGNDTITFYIPTSDPNYNNITKVWTISPDSILPYIWGGHIVIDGTSQTTNVGNTNIYGPEICINGSNTLDYGFVIASTGNVIKGFVIGQFSYGIVMDSISAQSNIVSNNYIGINYNGTSAYANSIGVVVYTNATNNTIMNNVISGNTMSGITISLGDNNIIKGNKIGLNAIGTAAIPNGDGIELSITKGNIIGGTTAADRNIISGNLNTGIVMNGNGTDNNIIKGNYIGTSYDGMQPVSNYTGVIFKSLSNKNTIGGTTAAERNIISGNTEIGVYIESSDSNTVSGNYVGPDTTGNTAFMLGDSLWQGNGIEINTTSNHNIIGGNTAGERNVISGNRVYGFIYYGNVSNNTLTGNYIGINAAGTSPLPNATGICVDGGSNNNLIEKNVLSGNISYGIFIVTTGTNYNQLKGNFIGTNAAGTDTVPNEIGLIMAGGARYNVIGGPSSTDRNIISGNRFDGIEIADLKTDSNQIIGNYIGTDTSGSLKLSNYKGIVIATNPKYNQINGNVVSGNKSMGIVLYEHADSNLIINNKIGTATDGTSNLGNGSIGITIYNSSKWNTIGVVGGGNIIAYNDTAGVFIVDNNSKYNQISANSMWGNMGLGIDLYPPLVNTNDAGGLDTLGPNDMMNYPVIDSAVDNTHGCSTIIKGTLDTRHPELCTVEIFQAVANFFGHGDGKTYLGRVTPDTAGNWSFVTSAVTTGDIVTTTATDWLMNTSEFSANKTVTSIGGIKENEISNSTINVYPNPFTNNIIINYTLKDNSDVEISLYSISGELIKNSVDAQGLHNLTVDLGDIKAGVYYLKFVNGENIITKKIVKTE